MVLTISLFDDCHIQYNLIQKVALHLFNDDNTSKAFKCFFLPIYIKLNHLHFIYLPCFENFKQHMGNKVNGGKQIGSVDKWEGG